MKAPPKEREELTYHCWTNLFTLKPHGLLLSFILQVHGGLQRVSDSLCEAGAQACANHTGDGVSAVGRHGVVNSLMALGGIDATLACI